MRGFTLIELLIVVALLGILSVALLAVTDPFEQIRKGQDTTRRDSVSEFYNATVRYYGASASFPAGLTTSQSTLLQLTGNAIPTLQAAGELKGAFSQLGSSNLSQMWASARTSVGSESVVGCYRPGSKAFQLDPNTKYDVTGGTSIPGCKSQGGAAICYWCVR